MIKKNNKTAACSGIAALTCLSTIILSGCQSSVDDRVTVNKAPFAEKTIYFEDKPDLEHHRKDMNFEAFTQWFFHCDAQLKTSDVKRDDTVGASSITLRVEHVDLKLSCPVEMCLSKRAPADTIAHEKGHVDVCRRFYQMAGTEGEKAALAVAGKEFYGMGANLEEARKNALDMAYQTVGNHYQQRIILLCDEASAKYDQLTQRYEGDTRQTPAVLVDMAMRETVVEHTTPIE